MPRIAQIGIYEMTSKENLELADEVYIPDSVMHNFGTPMPGPVV
jgi:hypothetical protein